MADNRCRFCARSLVHSVLDLGETPLANSLIRPEDAGKPEPRFPLHAFVCDGCFLMQVPEIKSAQAIFSDYLYFSSYSTTWVEHAHSLARDFIARLSLNSASKVIEIASNDGYLLQWFHKAGIPVLGIEPAKNVAKVASDHGIETEVAFFGKSLAQRLAGKGVKADLLVANNVLAHVPDIHDFTGGLPLLLAADGILSIEFPHLLNLIKLHQFDTIYHEHFSYLSAHFVKHLFEHHGLKIIDIVKIDTHGGSLRVIAARRESKINPATEAIEAVLKEEHNARLDRLEGYSTLKPSAEKCRDNFNAFLAREKKAGRSIAAYGAPAKGNTFLNYCGVTSEQIKFTVDRNPHKQSCLLPGSRIPVLAPPALHAERPDYVVILPWNLKNEISKQLDQLRNEGTKFVTAIPKLDIF